LHQQNLKQVRTTPNLVLPKLSHPIPKLVFGRPTFIVPNFEKEDDSAAKAPPKTQAIRGSRIARVHFSHVMINFEKEMDDVEEVDGTSTQLETLQQPKIPQCSY
jgi:hypothetical protein